MGRVDVGYEEEKTRMDRGCTHVPCAGIAQPQSRLRSSTDTTHSAAHLAVTRTAPLVGFPFPHSAFWRSKTSWSVTTQPSTLSRSTKTARCSPRRRGPRAATTTPCASGRPRLAMSLRPCRDTPAPSSVWYACPATLLGQLRQAPRP
eukprot:3926020-Rhodomonas_salina.3